MVVFIICISISVVLTYMIRSFLFISLLSASLTGSLLFLLTGCGSGNATGRSYYISPSGSDDNEGSLRYPWRTLERVNRMIFNHGDTILFESGAVFNGTFYLDSIDSGDEDGYVIISSYGPGRAVIDGGTREGIIINNAEYFKVGNLVVKGSGRKTGNLSDGILVQTSESFALDNLEVFGFQHSGVHINGSKNAKLNRISAHDNGFAGINVSGDHVNDPLLYDNEDLYIGHCKAFDNPGDPTVLKNHSGNGIVASSVDGGTIEYCEASGNGWDMPWTGNGPVGIWIWDCNRFTIQYCVSHENKTNPVAADGGGFDLDGGVSNSIIQYCLSWSNQGPGIGLFEFGASKKWENNVVRYNISRNDGVLNGASLSVWKGENGGSMQNCSVYNNTFYNDTARGVSLWITSSINGLTFTNNIFIYNGSFLGKGQKLPTESFTANCYWDLSAYRTLDGSGSFRKWTSSSGINSDPMLEDPRRTILPDPELLNEENLHGFMLQNGSPAAGKGIDPGSPFGFNNTGIGITGSPVKHDSIFDIGAVGFKKR
jgi:hypothetical protein